MIARNLTETARSLVSARRGRPRQTDLRRAVSATYYAAFHRLMQCCADRLVGTGGTQHTAEWRRVYRALNHGPCAKVCNSGEVRALSPMVRKLTDLVPDLKSRRDAADYDPAARFTKSEVLTDIATTKAAMDSFDQAPNQDQRTLAVLLLFRERADGSGCGGRSARAFPSQPDGPRLTCHGNA